MPAGTEPGSRRKSQPNSAWRARSVSASAAFSVASMGTSVRAGIASTSVCRRIMSAMVSLRPEASTSFTRSQRNGSAQSHPTAYRWG